MHMIKFGRIWTVLWSPILEIPMSLRTLTSIETQSLLNQTSTATGGSMKQSEAYLLAQVDAEQQRYVCLLHTEQWLFKHTEQWSYFCLHELFCERISRQRVCPREYWKLQWQYHSVACNICCGIVLALCYGASSNIWSLLSRSISKPSCFLIKNLIFPSFSSFNLV